ncbi:hypothetical protein WMY93_018104 [Mugilogobius chulae]|uniref:Alkylated DNA repair protein AlkB homologue 8 N-terminal domain-containing protein n=1 Tax=Mugilogobius chulae TaxID=88201 RepID=A0AAW0NT45_9GOBI
MRNCCAYVFTETPGLTLHTDTVVKKARQRLYFLRKLRNSSILTNFYRCTIESLLTGCITVWDGNCTAQSRKALQRTSLAAVSPPSRTSIAVGVCTADGYKRGAIFTAS